MQSTVGPVKGVQMAYNARGQSTGVATVIFKNRGDGNKAHGACKLPLALVEEELMERPQQDDRQPLVLFFTFLAFTHITFLYRNHILSKREEIRARLETT
jgi:hypothetical protein